MSSEARGARVGVVVDGKYALLGLLGQGGMGEIYEARHTKLGRRVAVKFLFRELAQRPELARRFENEAMAAGALEHENIGGVYDVGALADGTPYLVLEYLDGEDLYRVLQRAPRLALPRAANIVVQACRGLAVVHERGIVHRDLKPANLFVTRRADGAELVKVIDFGIAKLRNPAGGNEATKTGVAVGTAYYMSPEQGRGEEDVGPKSDVYSLGVILYELLSGRRPHEGDSPFQIVHRMLTEAPPPLEELRPGLPPAVYAIVRKAMAIDAEHRFAGVRELAEALAPYGDDARVESAAAAIAPSWASVAAARSSTTRPETDTAHPFAPTERSSPASTSGGTSIAALRRSPSRRHVGLVGAAMSLVAAAAAAGVAARIASTRESRPPVESTSLAAPAVLVDASSRGAVERSPSGRSVEPSDRPADSAPSPLASAPANAAPIGTASAMRAALSAPMSAPVFAPKPAPKPVSSARSPKKPDCAKTYTLDSEGNKHFRPECFVE